MYRLFYGPLVRASTWMYFTAAGFIGFGALEAMIGVFWIAPEVLPFLIAGIALHAFVLERVRRGIRLLRVCVRLRRRRRAHRITTTPEKKPEMRSWSR